MPNSAKLTSFNVISAGEREFDFNAKVILVTGYEDKEKSKIVKNNGLLGVVEKPIKLHALENTAKKT